MRSSSVCQMIALSSKFCQKRQFPRVMRVWVLWRVGTISCKDKIRALRLDVEDRFGSIVGVAHQCVPWLVRHAIWLLNRFQRRQHGATAFENLKGVSYKKPLMQFGERCHWLEAERITHKYDPRWGTGVWLGRHSASDVHLIGTPGDVIQVRTVRRLTRDLRNDDVSKRAFDNFIGSPRNLSGSKHLCKSKQLMVRCGP